VKPKKLAIVERRTCEQRRFRTFDPIWTVLAAAPLPRKTHGRGLQGGDFSCLLCMLCVFHSRLRNSRAGFFFSRRGQTIVRPGDGVSPTALVPTQSPFFLFFLPFLLYGWGSGSIRAWLIEDAAIGAQSGDGCLPTAYVAFYPPGRKFRACVRSHDGPVIIRGLVYGCLVMLRGGTRRELLLYRLQP